MLPALFLIAISILKAVVLVNGETCCVQCCVENPQPKQYPQDCGEALSAAPNSDIHLIQFDGQRFLAVCESNYDGGNWTIIQRRMNGEIDFYRNWNDYKFGFGDLTGEFWIGLEKLYALTNFVNQELLIVLTSFDGETRTAKYDNFAIGDESEGYALKVLGTYSGTAGDSLAYHKSYKFSTKDKKNDIHASHECAKVYMGAWWYKFCYESNLNGRYSQQKTLQDINWKTWTEKQNYIKFTQMMIRPKV